MQGLKRVLTFCAAATLSLLAFAACAVDDGVAQQRYPLPQRGYFEMKVPVNWTVEVKQPPTAVAPAISLAPREGKPFVFTITPAWSTVKIKLSRDKEALRRRVAAAARGIRLFAVEENIKLVEFNSASGPGFYFSATDKAPLVGGYKFMTKGEIVVNDLVAQFTLLTNEGQDNVVRSALQMLQGASHVRAARLPRS